jgi:hypothetical protein
MALVLSTSTAIPSVSNAADHGSAKNTVIQLWTTEPGHSFASSWGHTFLRVKTFEPEYDRTFDFGRYEVTSSFVADLLRDELPYHLESNGSKHTFEWMKARDRTLVSRTIDMPEARARALATHLTALDTPEHRHFNYEPATANCATKVRDILDDVVFDGAWSTAAKAQPSISFHDANEHIMADRPGYRWLVSAAFGPGFHTPRTRWEMTVLPGRLASELDAMTGPDGAIDLPQGVTVGPPKVFHTTTRPARPARPLWVSMPVMLWTCLTLGLVPALVWPQRPLSRRSLRGITWTWSILGGLLGIATAMMIAHPSARYGTTIMITAFHPMLCLLPLVVQRAMTRPGPTLAVPILWAYAALPLLGALFMPSYGQPLPYHVLPAAITQLMLVAAVMRGRSESPPR